MVYGVCITVRSSQELPDIFSCNVRARILSCCVTVDARGSGPPPNRTAQASKYAIFKVDDTRSKTIEVTPIDEWWHFKRATKGSGKVMTVKEAEELMKKQEHFMGPLSLANKVLGKKSLVSCNSHERSLLLLKLPQA